MKQLRWFVLLVAAIPGLGRAAIRFSRPAPSPISLRIYDAAGCLISWDGCDDRREKSPGGVYFCALESGRTRVREKLVRLE